MMCVFRVLSRELCVPVYQTCVPACAPTLSWLIDAIQDKKTHCKGVISSTVRYLQMFLGSSMVVELAGTLPSFLAGSKIKTLIYQSFYFAFTAKNDIFGSLLLRSAHNSDKLRFNAWFGLFYSEFYSELNSQEAHQICGSNTFHLPFFLAPSRCKTPFFFNSAMYFSIWRADIPHCSANCLAEMEASARMN